MRWEWPWSRKDESSAEIGGVVPQSLHRRSRLERHLERRGEVLEKPVAEHTLSGASPLVQGKLSRELARHERSASEIAKEQRETSESLRGVLQMSHLNRSCPRRELGYFGRRAQSLMR